MAENLPLKWADKAMFQAEKFDEVNIITGVVPSVKLLWMTPDPLGAIASMAAMYEGRVIRDLSRDLSLEDRARYFKDVLATHLDTPLEAVKFQFLFEGVDRATTHQIVRSRHQSYAQESLRFAVVDDLMGGTSLPPSLWGTDPVERRPDDLKYDLRQIEMRDLWDGALQAISSAYAELIDRGMPAEEARGLLPHATATRMVVVTDLRTLKAEAGNRLCTQAQFHWRLLISRMIEAIRNYGGEELPGDEGHRGWQYEEIASSSIFRPVCYQIGKCPFRASFDRACSIRKRVEDFAESGVASSNWGGDFDQPHSVVAGVRDPLRKIKTEEWLADPSAARSRPSSRS